MTTSAITATGLRKSYDDNLVLDGVDLDIATGTVFSLLGVNGSGKTTIVRILSTLIPDDGGQASVGGYDVAADAADVRSLIGVTGQFSAVDRLLTGRENLMLMADLRHLGRPAGERRVGELLERFELADRADQPLATYSGGMVRRLDLAMTLVGDPRIIFLDEPTTGLDPRSRLTMWQIIRELVADGVTIFMTTQYLEEADRLSDRVGLLEGGRIVAEGTPLELKRRTPGGHLILRFTVERELTAASTILGDVIPDVEALTLHVPTDGSVQALRSVLGRLESEAVDVDSLEIHATDLDDVFLSLTGGPAAESLPERASRS